MEINKLGPGKSWRVVHDGLTVMLFQEMEGLTETIHQAFETVTREECLTEIARLGLLIPVEDVISSGPTVVSENIVANQRQIRQALTRVGLRDQVEAIVAVSDKDTKDWYDWSPTFERYHSKVIQMGALLKQTEEQMDDLFKLASTL